MNGVNFELVLGSLVVLLLFLLVVMLLLSVPGIAFVGIGVDDTIPLALFITHALKVPAGFSNDNDNNNNDNMIILIPVSLCSRFSAKLDSVSGRILDGKGGLVLSPPPPILANHISSLGLTLETAVLKASGPLYSD